MRIIPLSLSILLISLAIMPTPASAQFIKIDDFVNSTPGNLSGQATDGPPGTNKWSHVGNVNCVIVTNSVTPGAGQPGSGTPLSPNAYAAATTTNDGAAVVPLPVAIPTTSKAATIFMQFDMSTNLTPDNVNWDIDASPGSDAGGSGNMVELNANASSRYGLTIRNANGYWAEMSIDGVHTFVPLPSTIYNIWFVINNSTRTFQIYMQDANPNAAGADLPYLTQMQIASTAASDSSSTSYTFTTNAIAFRNSTPSTLQVFVFGLGGGGDDTQYTYDLYEDASGLDLTNPVTGAPPVSPPVISGEPQSEEVFAGGTAAFTVAAGGGGLHYHWMTNGVALADGGNISGSATAALTITNVSSSNALNYVCQVSNVNPGAYESTNTQPASLTIVTPNGAFETAEVAENPLHVYPLSDAGDPSSGTEVAYDNFGGDNGLYGINAQNGFNGVAGPTSGDGFPGFPANNLAAQFTAYDEPSHVTVSSPWNLNTNSVTLTAWINPGGSQANSTGILFNAGGGSDAEGLNYSTSGNSTLGYTWNNDANTTSWDSGLQPPQDQWSFVSLVVTATNATISLMNTNGLLSSTHNYPHPVAAFDGTTMIGDNPASTAGTLTFFGAMAEVGVFNQALSPVQLQSIFTSASDVSSYPPTNAVALATTGTIYPGQSAQFSSINGGSAPLSYNWQLNGVNLTDGPNSVGIISGSATPSLTISNLAPSDAGQSYNLTLVTTSGGQSFTSSVPAVLSVTTPNAAQIITTTGFEPSGDDWTTANYWSDGNSAFLSAYSEPGSTYQIVAGTLERSPGSNNAAFPGEIMVVEGDGVLLDGNSSTFPTNTVTAELRLKQSGSVNATNYGTAYVIGGTVTFPLLELNGGQVDNGTSSTVAIDGTINVLTNSAIYADSAADGSIRSCQIDAQLTGAGTLTYAYLSSNATNNDLAVSNPSNTFTGQWNVVQGALLGNASNSLGTNTITVGPGGALETTYDINNPAGNLVLNGQMYLYTTDTFNGVTVAAVNLPEGTYTFAQLHSLFPTNFPTTWPVQLGSVTGTNTGAGSIIVLKTLAPQITQQPTPASLSLYPGQTAQFAVAATGAQGFQWWFTNLSNVAAKLTDGDGVLGSQTTQLTISNVSTANAGSYVVVLTNAAGTTVSTNAELTILTPGSATIITMSVVQPNGEDWNTGADWSDGNPASLSAYSEPGSTYEVLPGASLRTPAGAANNAYPGDLLVISNGASLILQHAGNGTISFPDLQLDGLMDNGADGLVTLSGEIDVLNNATITTDSNSPPPVAVNFDVAGGIGDTNYAGYGAYPDLAGYTNWNPIAQTGGTGTTTAPSLASDGITQSPITLSINTVPYGEGTGYGAYDTEIDSTDTVPNSPQTLESDYFYLENTFTPNIVINYISNSLNNVPPGVYNLYLYGDNGGNQPGISGFTNDWGTTFTVNSDLASPITLNTSNNAVLTNDHFMLGLDYVVFSNIVVGAGGTIDFSYTPNVNVTSEDYFGPNSTAAFNGLQLVTVPPATPGSRPITVDSLLTGNASITYQAGSATLTNDLNIAGAANTFSGPWNIVQGTLLGSAPGSLGTNSITVGPGAALETSYNLNDSSAGLILNGQLFLHEHDTFLTLTLNGAALAPGTYMFTQLNRAYPQNFPASWPLQSGSSANTGSGSIIVLTGPAVTLKPPFIAGVRLSGTSLTLSGTNGSPSGSYHVLTTTNLSLSITNWSVLTNGSYDVNGNFSVTLPTGAGVRQAFYSLESP